jgi:hypothetical protein
MHAERARGTVKACNADVVMVGINQFHESESALSASRVTAVAKASQPDLISSSSRAVLV